MTEVVFGPIKETTDWRWREILDLEPFEVMEELKELDTALFAARSELREAVRELADFEDRLHGAKQEVLDGILNGTDQDLADSLFKGGTKDERAQRQETYLAGLEWVKQAGIEIKVARERKDNAQVAFDSLLDRQVNLGKFANMYSATAHLLAKIQDNIKELIVERMPDDQFGGESVTTQAPLVLEDEVLDAMEIAIPASMAVSPDDAEALEAAIKRHQAPFRSADKDLSL